MIDNHTALRRERILNIAGHRGTAASDQQVYANRYANNNQGSRTGLLARLLVVVGQVRRSVTEPKSMHANRPIVQVTTGTGRLMRPLFRCFDTVGRRTVPSVSRDTLSANTLAMRFLRSHFVTLKMLRIHGNL